MLSSKRNGIQKISYSELQRQRNYFEYRYDEKSFTYYLFNPITGEKILETDYERINRSKSLWCQPTKPNFVISKEALASNNVQSIILNTVSYESRRNISFRRFRGWKNDTAAANHIIAVLRGFLARQYVRRLISKRYCKIFDVSTELYYFQDNENTQIETSWYKPRLAYAEDISTNDPSNDDDYMAGSKYSDNNGLSGPYYQITKCGKGSKSRAIHYAFLPINTNRIDAVTSYKDIDLDNSPIGSIISWMNGVNVVDLNITEYAYIRTAESSKRWSDVIRRMNNEYDNERVQLYGFFSFSKTQVPVDNSGLLHHDGEIAMGMCIRVIIDDDNRYNATTKVFALLAFHNILSTTAGRTEYFDISSVTEMGEGRHVAIEAFITTKIVIFNKYFTKIQMESVESTDTREGSVNAKRPTRRSAELVEYSLVCLSDMANQNEYREQMAILTTQQVIYALKIYCEEASVMIAGLRYLYHLCYRCESGHEIIRNRNVERLFQLAHNYHSGDADVMYQCRRLELAVQDDGWRGNVEDQLHRFSDSSLRSNTSSGQISKQSRKSWKSQSVRDMNPSLSVDVHHYAVDDSNSLGRKSVMWNRFQEDRTPQSSITGSG